MKQYVTLPEPAGTVWASGPSLGADHVLAAGTYMVALPVDLDSRAPVAGGVLMKPAP